MPELPEVETVVRDLRPHLVGARISALRVSKHPLRRPWKNSWRPSIIGRTVQSIERRGKWIRIDLGGPLLLVHLGMTGQFTVRTKEHEREDHTHLVFGLNDGAHELRFRDVRRFGSVSFYTDSASLEEFFNASGLGPEPWEIAPEAWRERVQGAKRCLKALLLNQKVIAGVGNIYADESLFEARLNPRRLACDLSSPQAESLRAAVVTVLDRAINLRGSTIRDYIGGSGLQGGFQREFRVYGRGGEACVRCRKPIEVIRLAGRSTHFCLKCQK